MLFGGGSRPGTGTRRLPTPQAAARFQFWEILSGYLPDPVHGHILPPWIWHASSETGPCSVVSSLYRKTPQSSVPDLDIGLGVDMDLEVDAARTEGNLLNITHAIVYR